jgi:hypothetical protein
MNRDLNGPNEGPDFNIEWANHLSQMTMLILGSDRRALKEQQQLVSKLIFWSTPSRKAHLHARRVATFQPRAHRGTRLERPGIAHGRGAYKKSPPDLHKQQIWQTHFWLRV